MKNYPLLSLLENCNLNSSIRTSICVINDNSHTIEFYCINHRDKCEVYLSSHISAIHAKIPLFESNKQNGYLEANFPEVKKIEKNKRMGNCHTAGPNQVLVVSGGCCGQEGQKRIIGGYAWAWCIEKV